jgi:hypothetical protein
VAPLILLSGCSKPSAANIELRKQNQDLRGKVEQLTRARDGDAATIRSLQNDKGTLPTLPKDRIDRLFTTHGLEIGRLTGGARANRDSTFDDSLKVYVVPTDASGDPIKAAGSFVVEAFDLSRSDSPLLGRWEFSVDASREHWYGDALLYEYVLPCPLPQRPRPDRVTVRVTFVDELTQRSFEAQKVVRVTSAPSPATAPVNRLSRQ